MIKPTITLGSKTTTGSVGKTVTVASATYSDNVTSVENLIINVYVQSPTLVVTTINGSFVPKSAGTYTVMYVAIDEMYNLSVVTYEVEVK